MLLSRDPWENSRQLATEIFACYYCRQFSIPRLPTMPRTADPGPFQSSVFLHEEMTYGSSAGHGGQTCCMWTYLYVNCWCTEEPAACTTFLPLGSSRCRWFSLWRTWPLSPSARTALWYSIQNKMPYANKKTVLTVTSCIGLSVSLGELTELEPKNPSAICFLTDAVSLCCRLMRVTDLQASNFRLFSLLCYWICCSIP